MFPSQVPRERHTSHPILFINVEFYQSWEIAQMSDLSIEVVYMKASFFSEWEESRRMGTSVQAILAGSDSM